MSEPEENETKPSQYADSSEASRIYLLPNSLTAGNLFFGFLAILQCIQANNATDPEKISGHFTQAVWFILFGVICDALDGRVARLGGANHFSARSSIRSQMSYPSASRHR